MERTKITNLGIIQKWDKNANQYYVLFDNDQVDGSKNKAFFAFEKVVKEGWNSLLDYQNLKEVELEFETNERGNKVTNIWATNQDNLFQSY